MHGTQRRDTVRRRAFCLATLCWAATAFGQDRVSDTVHNLAAWGPGQIRAESESQVCIFCHAPHNTKGVTPLWNRDLPTSSYQIYDSSTLDAVPGQPTGSSKLCLSCHDGTIALGRVLSRPDQIRMLGGDFLPSGLSNLGTDLSDDHPISFHYTAGIAASDAQLVSPAALPPEVKLDLTGQLQCTSCHDAHHNLFGSFLVKRLEFGELCTACHNMNGWNASSHQTSGAVVAGSQAVAWPFNTTAENACRSCHRSHSAGGRERLLIFEDEEENCLSCHDGSIARTNMRAEIDKFSAHDPQAYLGIHDAAETGAGIEPHVECADCHNAHAVSPLQPQAGYIPIGPTLTNVRGVTSGGAPVARAQYEYEVCFRCHGDSPVPVTNRIVRSSDTANLRLEFSSAARSFHPVVTASAAGETPSLIPGLPTGSMIRCTDCHNNDSGPRAGGGGPDGPHGSNYDFLLERNYTVTDDNLESEFEYALCYKCHQQSVVLSSRSFEGHVRHVVEERAPCSACHDPHGISGTLGSGGDQTRLINFDITLVQRHPVSLRRDFKDLGSFAGSCTLECHGAIHDDKDYGLP